MPSHGPRGWYCPRGREGWCGGKKNHGKPLRMRRRGVCAAAVRALNHRVAFLLENTHIHAHAPPLRIQPPCAPAVFG